MKAKIYQYTGIYLANKEELEYIQSKEFWKSFTKMATHKDNDMSPRDIQSLLIGMWQADRGYTRPMPRFYFNSFKKPRLFWKSLNWFATLYLVIKWDLQKLWRRK